MARLYDPQLARRWRQRLDRFDDSAVTVARFCQLEGVSVASFYQWRRKLQAKPASEAPSFVAIEVDPHHFPQHHSEVARIELPGGALVKIRAGATVSEQRDLIQAILEATAEVAS